MPTLLVLWLVWLPGVASVVLGFFRWEGVGSFDTASWVGTENYKNIFTNYPPFQPAIEHNLIWLGVLFLIPTPLGIFLAVLLDKEIRGSRFYQTSLFIPVVLSLALVGFMWQLIYSPDQGLLNQITGGTTDWYGDPSINLWAVLVAVCWKTTGYVMLLYLAGLKAVDPTLREAAKVDGASETQTFFKVVFPVMRPINIVVLVITFIEAPARLRHRLGGQQGPQRARADLDPRDHQHRRRGQPDRLRLGAGHDHAGDLVGVRRAVPADRPARGGPPDEHHRRAAAARRGLGARAPPLPATERPEDPAAHASSSSSRCSGSSRSSTRC